MRLLKVAEEVEKLKKLEIAPPGDIPWGDLPISAVGHLGLRPPRDLMDFLNYLGKFVT